MRDTIFVKEFLPHTQQGLMEISRYLELGIEDMAQPQDWAALVFLLKQAPGTAQYFPAGKWATIQRIEAMLIDWADAVWIGSAKSPQLTIKA